MPFPRLLAEGELGNVVRLAKDLEDQAGEHGLAYLSLGPALPDVPASYEIIPDILAKTRNVFLSGVMAADGLVSQAAVQACGRIIAKAASITPDGFTNLRFAALAGVRPFGPFFPGSFSDGKGTGFALAMECADAAVEAFRSAATINEGRQSLLNLLNAAARELARIADDLSQMYEAQFIGFDFSLAPFPQDCCSLGGAMERMGVEQVGLLGSLAAAGVLADTLDQGLAARRFQRDDDAGAGGFGAGVALRRDVVGQRPAAVLGRMRHRAGHRALAWRRDCRAAIGAAAGRGRALYPPGQAADRPADAGAGQTNRRDDGVRLRLLPERQDYVPARRPALRLACEPRLIHTQAKSKSVTQSRRGSREQRGREKM